MAEVYFVCTSDEVDYKSTGTTLTTKLDAMETAIANAGDTAEGVLTKIKTVDGSNSGLDADTVDGKHSSEFATSDHTHSNYAAASDLTSLETAVNGKADAAHIHAQYASVDDVSALQTAVDGKANSTHTHSEYAGANHTHSEYAGASHTHSNYASIDDVETLETTVNGKANASHTHAQSDISGLATALSGKSDTSHSHAAVTTSANGFMSSADKTKLDGIATGANKTTVDSAMSSTSTNPVQNKVVNTALAGKADATHTHTLDEVSETTNKKIMTAEERTKLSGIAAGANAYTHPATHAASMITGLSGVATSGNYNDLSNKPTIPTIPSSLPANGGNSDTVDGKHAADFALAGHTHTAAQVGAAASSHNHNSAYINKSLQMTADDGNVSLSWSGKNVVTEFTNLASGMYTVYSPAGATNNPNTGESFRFMMHKTGSANYGWIMAYGAKGSVYTGYIDNGNWQGWKCIFDANPQPLWTGGYYMTAGHTVTPTKTLSECRNGWLLLWSDFDPGEQANNTDFCTSVICKRAYTGQKWAGGEWYCDVPRYSAGTATDSESRVIKVLKIYDAKIVGTENNAAAPRNDVVLRAVYEI